ncbi:MAG: response regulator transcription factor [Bacteroidetes bacterium]|nr:response regulator transcription factor [Bacteroidota bacterium]
MAIPIKLWSIFKKLNPFASSIMIKKGLFHIQQYPQALRAAQTAMQMVQQQNRTAELCRVHICMASVYIETEEWDSALEHCNAAQLLAHQNHDARTEAEVKSIHGKLCLRTRQYKKGKQLLEESAAMGREKELWPHAQKCEELLYEIAGAEGNATAALHHCRQVTALRQQQLDIQIQQRMLLLQMQFDTHQKDAELDRLREQYSAITTIKRETAGNYRLTPREQSILELLAQGLSYKQAAAKLGISYETTREHIANLYKKLSVGTNTEAVAKAVKEGLV